jgi:Protein of unknown function (DUF3225)
MEINLPDVVKEVEDAFERYEQALVTNDVPALEAFFWNDARAIRYGAAENLYGIDDIRAFRRARSPVGLERRRERIVITTFGRHFATTHTLFHRDSARGRIGRQSQSWVKFTEGWRVVSGHISSIDAL